MSTAIVGEDGVTRLVDFEKTVSGGWRFRWGHRYFMAKRNEAGFAGRDWDLYEFGEYWIGPGTIVADMLRNRAACVDEARRLIR